MDAIGFGSRRAILKASVAVLAVTAGGGILAASLADQDRAATSVLGILTVLVGIAALVAQGEVDGVQVDRDAALLFVVIGAIVFVLGLLPWVSGRRRVTTYS